MQNKKKIKEIEFYEHDLLQSDYTRWTGHQVFNLKDKLNEVIKLVNTLNSQKGNK